MRAVLAVFFLYGASAQSGGWFFPDQLPTRPTTAKIDTIRRIEIPGKKAEEKCREYAQYVYQTVPSPIFGGQDVKISDCMVAEPLIVGGTPAKLKEFPHMAIIGFKLTENKTEWFCGGSLISPRFILSAAHCHVSSKMAIAIARLGDLNIESQKDRARHIDVKIVEEIIHPKYKEPKAYNDIALLKLEKDVGLSTSIRPLCLHTSTNIREPQGIASGWGFTKFSVRRSASSTLQKVNLTFVSADACQTSYASSKLELPDGIDSDTMICAGGQEGKDICSGDSGGPLQVILKDPYCMYSQVAITSFGIGCGFGIPGGFTRVSYYISWIESHVWP